MRPTFLLCLALTACSSDPAPVDSGLPPGDIATEIAAWIDTGAPTDATDDRMALPDFGPRDTGADVVAIADVPAADAGDATAADAGMDAVAVGDAGSDVPADVRINCAAPGAPDVACRSHADCSMCAPAASGAPWCCRANGFCGVTTGALVCPPPACSPSVPCAAGQSCCDGFCRNLQNDPMTCGSCNARCTSGRCVDGVCAVPDAGGGAARD